MGDGGGGFDPFDMFRRAFQGNPFGQFFEEGDGEQQQGFQQFEFGNGGFHFQFPM
jgi:hypothetical protein